VENNYSYWLAEQFKKQLNLPSDRQVALRIEKLTEASLGQIKKGDRHLTPEQAMFIAETCGFDIGEVLVRLDMEKAKSPAIKAELEKVLKRLAGVFAGIMLTMSLALMPAPSEAAASA
jgi:hypothetical protein